MKIFKPSKYCYSVDDINFEKLFNSGFRGLIFDIDSTLVEHGKGANPKIAGKLTNLKEMGFNIGLISNNDKDRIKKFNIDFNFPYIAKAKKPLPGNYKKIVSLINCNIKNTVFIGDQLFTDILGANLAGIRSILVKPVSKNEPKNIKFKRKIEKIF